MGETVGPLVDELLRRIRDVGAQGTSRALVRRFLAHAEGLVAIAFDAHIETFTLTTTPERCVYANSELTGGSRIGKLLTFRESNRDIPPSPLEAFAAHSLSWFRQIGPRPEAWTALGKDLFVLWPAGSTARTVEVRAVAAPLAPDDTYTGSDSDTTTLDTRWTPQILDLAELFLLLRVRRLDALKAPMERLKALQVVG